MEEVVKEWAEAWKKTKVNYGKDIYEMLSSQENREFLRILKRYITKSSLVLEGGCGYGHKCILFSRYFGASVVGVDIVLEPLKSLENYIKGAGLSSRIFTVVCDVTKLPFRDGIFDAVTSFGVVEHFRSTSEVIATLSEAQRVLKIGSHLILTIPNFAATFRNKLVIAMTRGKFGMYHRSYTKSVLTNILKTVKGMRIVDSGFLPFGFRSLIKQLVEAPSPEKIIYFSYHAIWRMLNFVLKMIGDDYQNPIYLVAGKHQ